ncbi:hypothetical protein KI387_024160, partial [Taxus chinensis]
MGSMRCVVVAVDGSEESMRALEWALDNIRLCPPQGENDKGGNFVLLHVQSPPTIYAGLSPGAIPFGGPAHVDVPAFTAAIEAHRMHITEAIMAHALDICSQRNVDVEREVVVGEPKELICETTSRLQADLLVMGSHTYGALKRMLDKALFILELCHEMENPLVPTHEVDVEKEVVVGEPKELICETTSRLQADLLVVGSHTHGALK